MNLNLSNLSEGQEMRAHIDNLRVGDTLTSKSGRSGKITAIEHLDTDAPISVVQLLRGPSGTFDTYRLNRNTGRIVYEGSATDSEDSAQQFRYDVQRITENHRTDRDRTRAAEKEMERAAARSELGMPPSSSPRRGHL